MTETTKMTGPRTPYEQGVYAASQRMPRSTCPYQGSDYGHDWKASDWHAGYQAQTFLNMAHHLCTLSVAWLKRLPTVK